MGKCSEQCKGGIALQWHITNECDQRCKHCYIYQSEGGVDKTEPNLSECKSILERFIKFCDDTHRHPNLVLTGGDPLLHPKFWEIAELIHDKGLNFAILGNPFHLNEEVCQKLYELGCKSYQLSLDGLEGTHDMFRKQGSWDATLKSIKLLQEAKIRTVIMSTVSKVNYKEIPKLAKIVVDLRVSAYAFARYCPTHDDTQNNISPDEYREFLNHMYKIYSELSGGKTALKFKDHLWIPYLYEEGLLKASKKQVITGGCHCGISHMTLLPDGTVYACRRFESPIGKIQDSSFYDLFYGPDMNQYRKIEGDRRM